MSDERVAQLEERVLALENVLQYVVNALSTSNSGGGLPPMAGLVDHAISLFSHENLPGSAADQARGYFQVAKDAQRLWPKSAPIRGLGPSNPD